MKTALAAAFLALLTTTGAVAQSDRPTILLVHGAFADASSWNGVISVLESDDYRVIAVANPLRSVKGDARYVADIANGIDSPVVLVGHSYGGSVISEAASSAANVKALVYVAAFAPDVGETAVGLSGKFPGSTLGSALDAPVVLTGGGKDLYIQRSRFHGQFSGDVSAADADVMAVGQRPIAEAALNEPASCRLEKAPPRGSYMAIKTGTSRRRPLSSWLSARNARRRLSCGVAPMSSWFRIRTCAVYLVNARSSDA